MIEPGPSWSPPPAPQATGTRPRVWTVFVAYGLVVACVVTVPAVAIFGWVLVQRGPGLLADPAATRAAVEAVAFSFPGISLSVLLNGAALAGIALAAAALSPVPWRRRLALGTPRLAWAWLPVVVVGTLAFSQALDAVAVLLGVHRYGFLPRMRELVRSLPPGSLAALAVIMSVTPGLCEELFFRGYLQSRLLERWGGPTAVAVSALLFGLLHLDPVQAPLAAALGLYLGHVAWRAGSIWPAVVAHAANNALATVGAAFIPDELGGRGVCLALVGGGLLVAAGCLALVHRASARSPQ